ncbi:MAG: cyclic nucleotide-binding domain-containing protein [Candidatus Magnetomorum sp.]|nr:cyclic nucleotide-binding domain-containing protein [Candidatus Magnetomorum sp.]
MTQNSQQSPINFLDAKNIFDIKDENKLKFFAKDDIIFHEGQQGFEAYYIKKGTVDIYRLSSNKRILLANLQAGEIFGEMSILSGEVRNANAVAKEDTSLVVIEKDILTSTMNETLPMVQSLAISLIKRLNNSNRKINEKPSNNTLLSVCTVLHLLFSRMIANRSTFSEQIPKNGIRYYDLCKTIKNIVPLAEVDIDYVLDHLVRHTYIKVFSEKADNGQLSKWIVIDNPQEFDLMIQKVKNSGGWVMENDPFIQDQEFMDIFDFSQMMNTSPADLFQMLSQGEIPQNLLFLHRAGTASWMEDQHKKKLYRRLYDSPFDENKQDKSWVA